MAKEFKSYLAGFAKLCDNYCENAKKIEPDPDCVKLIKIYQKGLEGACAGLSNVLSEHYDSADRERRAQMDKFVQYSGVLPLLEEANRVIGKNSFDSARALFSAGGIFHELKKIIRMIPGLTQLIVPFVGAIPGLLDLIDQFVEEIGKLFGSSSGGSPSGGTTVERPPPLPTDTLKPCEWKTIVNEPGRYEVYPSEGFDPTTNSQFTPQIEIKVDDNAAQPLDQFKQYTGKKIQVHLVPDPRYPNTPVGISWKKIM